MAEDGSTFPDAPTLPTTHPDFNPYSDNGGSVVAIAGQDYAIIGADTRLSAGFTIYTREQRKLFKLSDKTVLGTTGCWCDTLTLNRTIVARMQMYKHDHNQVMSTPAIAQMLSTMLYYKRFFPYYTSNILAGLDGEGKGCVYSYDPIGHYERSNFHAGGSAMSQLQPLLDSLVGQQKTIESPGDGPLPGPKALSILNDLFISAAERDIYTGDSIFINIITASGIHEDKFQLRKD